MKKFVALLVIAGIGYGVADYMGMAPYPVIPFLKGVIQQEPPATETVRPEAQEQEQHLQAMLAEAVGYASQNPDDYAGILSRFEELRTAGAGTDYEKQAQEHITTWQAARDAAQADQPQTGEKRATADCCELLHTNIVAAYVDNLNVYVETKVVGTFEKGHQFDVTGREGDWIGVAWATKEGEAGEGWAKASELVFVSLEDSAGRSIYKGKTASQWTSELKDENPRARRTAAARLAKMGAGAKDAIPHLTEMVKEEDTDVRLSAVYALGKIGPSDKETAVAALATALDDQDLIVRKFAVEALANVGDASVVALTQALGDENLSVRKDAAKALLDLGQPALQAITQAAVSNEDEQVRKNAETVVKKIMERSKGLSGMDKKVRFHLNGAPLQDALATLEEQSGVSFVLPSSASEWGSLPVTLNAQKARVGDGVDQIMKQTNLAYTVRSGKVYVHKKREKRKVRSFVINRPKRGGGRTPTIRGYS